MKQVNRVDARGAVVKTGRDLSCREEAVDFEFEATVLSDHVDVLASYCLIERIQDSSPLAGSVVTKRSF